MHKTQKPLSSLALTFLSGGVTDNKQNKYTYHIQICTTGRNKAGDEMRVGGLRFYSESAEKASLRR